MTTTDQDPRGWIGRTLVDNDGDKIGRIDDIYMDDDTGRPEWLAVSTGWFGNRVSFVPLAGATRKGDDLSVRYGKDQVKDAPNAEADGHLSPEEEERLYRHYGVSYSSGDQQTGDQRTTGTLRQDTGHDTSGRSTDNAMTRSEEELRVSKTMRQAGTVRLRKWVETEHVQQTVPVAHEEVRVEREPITKGNVDRAMDGPEISSEEHEMPLYQEEVVANKEVVPKERVRLDKEVVQEQRPVEADLRKEQIDVDKGTSKRS
jgi:uncharacterized protein (TIGR02271 family)